MAEVELEAEETGATEVVEVEAMVVGMVVELLSAGEVKVEVAVAVEMAEVGRVADSLAEVELEAEETGATEAVEAVGMVVGLVESLSAGEVEVEVAVAMELAEVGRVAGSLAAMELVRATWAVGVEMVGMAAELS